MSNVATTLKKNIKQLTPKDVKTRSKFVKKTKQNSESQSPQDDIVVPPSFECEPKEVASYESFDCNTGIHIEMCGNFLNRLQALYYVLEDDLDACDAKWTLFVAAALSYRYDAQLKPFPSHYMDETTGCNINGVISVINDTPKLGVIFQNITEKNFEDLNTEVMELLYWVLIEMKQFHLRSLDDNDTENLIISIDSEAKLTRPLHAFELISPMGGIHSSDHFRQRCGEKLVKLAFYGNKLDVFYSIVNNGFDWKTTGILNKPNQVFKLTNDFETSIQFSPISPGWGASNYGPLISCTALCDFAYDEEHIRVSHIRDKNNTKFYVNVDINTPELLRIRYLFFHGPILRANGNVNNGGFINWVNRHRYTLSLCSYLLVMLSITVANSGNCAPIRMFIVKKLSTMVDFCKHLIAFD